MEDFSYDSASEIEKAIAGKVVKGVETYNNGDDCLVFHFTDGKSLRLQYDWIYEWELIDTRGGQLPDGVYMV